MKVELIETAGGDISIVNSARVSFDKESEYVSAVGDKSMLSERDAKLVNFLASHNHMTPFRHNFIQLRCSVPLFLARQLMKHQAGLTWNEVSRRYIDDVPRFYDPVMWRERPKGGIKQGSGGFHPDSKHLKKVYKKHLEDSVELYELMLDMGVAPEMARSVLPQSMMVDFIWSGNLLAFAHVYKLRSGEGAQEEAKVFAELMRAQIAPAFPIGWKALVQESV